MRNIPMVFLSFFLAGCDTVTNTYPTLEDAYEDRLFERGWLPEILPASTFNIRTSNDLDMNTSQGHFHFVQSDAVSLYSKLSGGSPAGAPFRRWQNTVENYQDKGYSDWYFQDEQSIWTFFCNEGESYCRYYMWLTQVAA